MTTPKLTKLELQIMEALWTLGRCSVREIQETFPKSERPAYTTVQTTIYRLEAKKALRRAKRISNADIFEATISRGAAQGRFIDELLGMFGGRMQPLAWHFAAQRHTTQKRKGKAQLSFGSLKRTKAWSDGWIQKIKDDQRAGQSRHCHNVSDVLPSTYRGRFGQIVRVSYRYQAPLP